MADLNLQYGVDDRTEAFENHGVGWLVAMAGPGTGKTYCLLKRIAALVARDEELASICYLTFIKEIANAFQADYSEQLGEAIGHAPRISTLHSFACRLLRNQGFRIGYAGELYFESVAAPAKDNNDGSDVFLADLLPLATRDGCRSVPALRLVLDSIKKAWRNEADINAIPEPAPSILPVAQSLAKGYRLIDWDQTIPLAHGLFREMNPIPDWIAEIQHYLVDEFQDFNTAEQSFIRSLVGHARSGVVVGDDDQSIYSGRGGSPAGMRALYDPAVRDTVSLQKCFRCKATIVGAANTFQTSMRPDPRPMLTTAAGGSIVCHKFKSTKAELAFLTPYLNERIAEIPENPKQKDRVICLFPSRKVLSFYFDKLSPNVPSTKRAEGVAPERQWLRRVLILGKKRDQRFIERLLLREYGDVKPRHREAMVRRIIQRDASPVDALLSLIQDGEVTGSAATAAQAFVDDCTAISHRDLIRIGEIVGNRLGIDPALAQNTIAPFLEAAEDQEDETDLDSVCDTLLPNTAVAADDLRRVQFLTMHGSKGLTRKNVILPGMEEAWLPGVAADEDLREKQRLFFVALTRATDTLLVTLPLRRSAGDPLNYQTAGRSTPSSFLARAGIPCAYRA